MSPPRRPLPLGHALREVKSSPIPLLTFTAASVLALSPAWETLPVPPSSRSDGTGEDVQVHQLRLRVARALLLARLADGGRKPAPPVDRRGAPCPGANRATG
jgi:hypothetical protein